MTWNPYWDELKEEFPPFPSPDWVGGWKKGSEWYSRMMYYRYRYSFAIPSAEVVGAILPLGPIIELGAGSGYWAEVLGRAGADVAAYDDGSWNYKRDKVWDRTWHEVHQGGPEDIAKENRPTLLLCWPDYDTPFAARCEQIHRESGGSWIAYVGEGEGGCTGDDEFHAALYKHWKVAKTIRIPQWMGLHDRLEIHERAHGALRPGV